MLTTSTRRPPHSGFRRLLPALLLVLASLGGPLGAYAAPGADRDPTPVRPAAVPAPSGDTAVITVRTGGTRSPVNAVGGVPGARLGFYDTQTASTPSFTCTADASGDCSITVPDTQPLGANRDKRFWVRQLDAPQGWYTNPALGTGTTVQTDPYRFQTGTQLRAGATYSSTVDFMIATGSSNNEASGGLWQNSVVDPVFPAKCGIDVALVLDLSNSVTAEDLRQLKLAANGFVDALTGTPSQVGLFTFATSAPASSGDTLPLTPVTTPESAAAVTAKINGYRSPGGNAGGTNWDRGLFQVAQSSADFDVAVVITDGNPTFYANAEGPGNRTRFREVENGIFSANAIKSEGTKVVAFGVGAGIGPGTGGSGDNLRAISGTEQDVDYFQTPDYATAGQQLRELALGNCAGSISVIKQVVPPSTPPGSVADGKPAGGWEFSVAGSTGVSPIAPALRVTAADTGAVNFPLDFSGGTTSAPVSVAETPQPGYTLQPVGGVNAVCVRLDTGAAVAVTNSGATGFSVTASTTYAVSCTVYNRAPDPAASLVVDKTWVVNGVRYADGDQPSILGGQAVVDGVDLPFAEERGGFVAGDSARLDEELDPLPAQCTLDSSRLTSERGAPADRGLPTTSTLQGGLNRYEITNVLTCVTRLSLDKTFRYGTADPSLWTLGAVAPPGGLPGPSGTSGVTADVTPDVQYILAESGGDPNFVQYDAPDAAPIPGSSGSFFCVEVGRDGTTPIPGFADGLNGGVRVPFGSWVRCAAINETSTMRLVKEVVNDNGGTAVPGDWNLTMTPQAPVPAGIGPITVPGASVDDAEYFHVRPGVGWNLSEAGPPGYVRTNLQCQIIRPRAEQNIDVSLLPGDIGTCWFTNNDQPARLTLIKTVTNDDGGTAEPTDWILGATGPTSGIEGRTGQPVVTRAAVLPGTYELSERDGPVGYTAGQWSCTGGTVTGSSVTVTVAADVVCTVGNDDSPASWSVIKLSDPPSGEVVRPGQEITYAVGLIRNPGIDPRNVVLTDDLSAVLDHATLVAGPEVTAGEARVDGTRLRWTVPVLSDELALAVYTVRVDDDAYGVTLRNSVTSPGSSPCQFDDRSRAATVRLSSGRVGGDAVLRGLRSAAADDECPTTTEHVTPHPPNPPGPPNPTTSPQPPNPPDHGNLPNTGGPSLGVGIAGLALLVAGSAALLWSRRRRPEPPHRPAP